jgi:redox-sensitive bicupin YhaK (pirin superfamily)
MPLDLLSPHIKDLGGGFTVRRLLPAARRQAVGPFLFFDHFGPLQVQPADQHDVRPHPHIGLATVTYLFDGALLHHDSTGARQRIEPGAVNWMTAGRGVVHSERRPPDLAGRSYGLHGLQLWVALPEAHEEAEPSFQHVAAADVPAAGADGAQWRVLVGRAHGLLSPVATLSDTLFVDYQLAPGSAVQLPGGDTGIQRALYVLHGTPWLRGADRRARGVPPQQLALLADGEALQLQAGDDPVRVVLVGGVPLGRRLIWWNFVASRPGVIERAALAWEHDALGRLDGETERIPLPEARWRGE